MIRAILFDFFDVFRTDGYNKWLKKHSFAREGALLTVTEKHDRGEYTEKEFFKAIADVSGEDAEEVEMEMETGNELNRALVEYVGTLHGKYKLALLSNAVSEYLRGELAKYELEQYFDEIVISSEVGLIKPEPEIFEHIMHRLGVTAQECIFTDDNPTNVGAAEKLGIHGIVFTDVPGLKEQIEKITSS
jgi:putative hydrolase of the HAD superfamily